MFKQILLLTAISLLLAAAPAGAQKAKEARPDPARHDVKFLEDITVESPASAPVSNPKAVFSEPLFTVQKHSSTSSSTISIEAANALQFKYSLLLDVEVEMVKSLELFKLIDNWFGTKYRLGGNSKDGIDCSAFMQVLFSSFYGIVLPRTAREQYNFSQRISRTDLREGDLIFFNTIGGVSHVGMYLQNNKFVHASSGGVTISDLFEDYWMRRFVGVGRVEPGQLTASSKP